MATNGSLVALQHRAKHYSQATKVEWFIGLLCNFNCSYCAEYMRSPNGKTEKMLKAVDLLRERVGDRSLHVLLGGGEPSIHPDIKKIVEYMGSKKMNLAMISNGSREPELYVDMMEFISSYTFSVHFEQDYHKTIDTILAVKARLNQLAQQGINDHWLQVNVMMAAGHFDEARQTIDLLNKNNVDYIIRRIRPLLNDDRTPILPKAVQDRSVYPATEEYREHFHSDYGYYSEEELKFLKSMTFKVSNNSQEFWEKADGTIESFESNANDVSLRKLNHFKGWKCWVGIERLHIYPNGDVYRNTCKQGGKLGNVFEDFKFPSEPVICEKDRCNCAWAINVSKVKEEKFLKYLRIAN